jgi:DNA-nicking Smr family endonuclease
MGDSGDDDDGVPGDDPGEIVVPIDGTLDLHTFHPREVKELLPEYLAACLDKGIFEVRVVHGKGTGTMRKTVQSLLGGIALVESWRAADEGAGGWGATLVKLKPK